MQSIRGTQGGYILTKKPNEIKLTNIFHAVDETVKTVQCKKESKKGLKKGSLLFLFLMVKNVRGSVGAQPGGS